MIETLKWFIQNNKLTPANILPIFFNFFLHAESETESKDIFMKQLFTRFCAGVIASLAQFSGMPLITGSFARQLSSETSNNVYFKFHDKKLFYTPSYFKMLADFIFETTKNLIIHIEFVSSHNKNNYSDILFKSLSLSKAIKYKKEIIPIIIQLPPKVKISKIDYPIIGRSYEANTIFLTQLPGIKLLEGLNKKVDNNEEFNDCDLLNFSLLPSLYQQFKKEDIFITLISGMFKIIPHIKDPINQQFCLTVFMSFLRMYFPDHLVKYIHSEANVMKFAELMQPFYNLVEAQGVTKGRAQERAEKEKALLESAKDLLGRGFSVEDAAKITTLEIEKVQALVA